MGNSKLCGGIPEFHLPKCYFKEPKKRGLSLAFKITISTVSGLLGIVCVLSFLIFLWLRKKKKTTCFKFFREIASEGVLPESPRGN